MKAFEEQVLDDAVKNSELWWDEEMERGILKHTFFPFVQYQKDKVTKKVDTFKAPSIKAKVPNYNNEWSVEMFDTKNNRLFPSEDTMDTPVELISSGSNIASILQCGGIWIGGKHTVIPSLEGLPPVEYRFNMLEIPLIIVFRVESSPAPNCPPSASLSCLCFCSLPLVVVLRKSCVFFI